MKTRRSLVVPDWPPPLAYCGLLRPVAPTEPLSGIEVATAVLSGTVLDTGGRPAPDACWRWSASRAACPATAR
jgi:hypothetical protein